MKTPYSKRCLRVGETVRRALSALFLRSDWQSGELENLSPRFTEVQMSADLSHAKAYFTAAAPNGKELLTAARPQIRRQLTPMLKLQKMPTLAFYPDKTAERAVSVDALFADPHISRDLEPT